MIKLRAHRQQWIGNGSVIAGRKEIITTQLFINQ